MKVLHRRARATFAALALVLLVLPGTAWAQQSGGELVFAVNREADMLDLHVGSSRYDLVLRGADLRHLPLPDARGRVRSLARRRGDRQRGRDRVRHAPPPRRDLPRRHAAERRSGQVQLRPHRRPGHGQPCGRRRHGLVQRLRGRRRAHDPRLLRAALPGLLVRAVRLARRRPPLAHRHPGRSRGVPLRAGRHRSLPLRVVDPGRPDRARAQPGLRLAPPRHHARRPGVPRHARLPHHRRGPVARRLAPQRRDRRPPPPAPAGRRRLQGGPQLLGRRGHAARLGRDHRRQRQQDADQRPRHP